MEYENRKFHVNVIQKHEHLCSSLGKKKEEKKIEGTVVFLSFF